LVRKPCSRIVPLRLSRRDAQEAPEPSALTAPEADYLIGFKDADELRKRLAKARVERSDRLRSRGISEDEYGQAEKPIFYSELERAVENSTQAKAAVSA
jgi:hypothetical protein